MENPILDYVKEYLNKPLKEKNNQKPEVAKFIKDHIMAAYDEYRDQGSQPDEIASVIDDMVSKNLLNDETFVDKLFTSVPQEELNNLPAGLYRTIMKDKKIPFIKKDSYFDKILKTDEVKDWQQDRTQPNYLKDLKKVKKDHPKLNNVIEQYIKQYEEYQKSHPVEDVIEQTMDETVNTEIEATTEVHESQEQVINNPAPEQNANQQEVSNSNVRGNTALLKMVQDVFKQENEDGVIMSETIMLACGFNENEVKFVSKKGLKEIPNLIQQKIDKGELTDELFLDKLFALQERDLEQIPIWFFAEIAKSTAFQNLSKDKQKVYISGICKLVGIDNPKNITEMEAEKVSINNQHYKDILAVYFSVTDEHVEGFHQALNQAYQETIDGKLQEMIDKAPALTKDPRFLRDFAPYKNHYGNLAENTEEVLALFEDTKEITKDKINALGLDKNSQYFSNTAARAGLAQEKLKGLAAALKAKGLIDKNQSTENFSVVDPAEKHSPVNKYVNAVKNVLVNYAKPQNLAKLGFIQIGTKAVQHFVEGAIPGIGAALGLAWKLGECAKKIHKDKQKASDVFKQALPDLTRGVVTVGASFIPVVGVAAGTIGSVASVAMKGIQAAHEEGLTFGHGFMKRIGQEFTKKGNLLNMGAAALGSMVAIEERKIGFIRSFMDKTGVTKLINNGKQGLGTLWDKIRGRGGVEQSASMENGLTMEETAKIEDAGVTDAEDPALQDDEVFGPKLPTDDRISDKSILYDPEGNPISADSEAANDEFYIGEDGGIHVRGATQTMGTEQSYASQVLHNNEGAFVDKNGWVAVRRDDGSVFYPKNDKGQLIALDQEKDKDLLSLLGLKKSVTRNLTENEMLDKAGNIVNKPIEQNNNTFENGQDVEGSFNNAGYEHNTTMHNGKDVYNMYKMEAGNEVRHIIDRNHNGIVDKGDEYITIQREKIGNEEVTLRARGTIGEKNESQTIYTKTYDEQGELQDTLKSYRTGTTRSVEDLTATDRQSAPIQTEQAAPTTQFEDVMAQNDNARNFNSLPENQQRELIDIRAKGIVAKESGDMATYQKCRQEFDDKFKDYVEQDQNLDYMAARANIPGTSENKAREHWLREINDKSLKPQERAAKLKEYHEYFGYETGRVENGVPQYERFGGNLAEEVAGEQPNPFHNAQNELESAIIREKGIRQAAEEVAAKEGEGVYSGIKAEMPAKIEQPVSQEVETETPVEQAVKQGVIKTETEAVSTTVTVRSAEELAQIDALQAQANQARDFNSLPERQQKELIEIKAKGIVAQENGDTAMYENYKKEFDEKFRDYVDKDRELDQISAKANIKGTQEYYQRQDMEDAIAGRHPLGVGNDWTPEERETKVQEFIEKYGDDMGTDKNGVRQYVRHGGGFKEEVPDVPQKNFAELGYQQQKDGTWILKNQFTTRVVTDVNQNGIPDAGDTYEQVTEIGEPGSSYHTQDRSSGQYVEPVREQINPSRNAQTELESAIIREKGIQQAAEETAKQATANEGEGVYSDIEAEMPAKIEQPVSQEVTETSNVSQKSYSDLGLVQDEDGTWTKTVWGNGKIAFTDTNNNGFYDDGEDKWKYSTVGRTIGPNEEREVLELVNQLQKQQVPEPELGR